MLPCWLAVDGTPTGASYLNTVECCFRDGTTDGVYNYAIRDDFGGNVVSRFVLDCTNPEAVDYRLNFSGTLGEFSGMTWDLRDNTFWFSGGGGLLANASASGDLLSLLLLDVDLASTGLAFDSADKRAG